MDPLTHSVLGVAAAMLLTPARVPRRAAALAGLAGGLLPDADVLLRSAADPLFAVEYHRHFTHSLTFLPVIGLLGAVTASLILRCFRNAREKTWPPLFLPAVIGGISHIFCDAWTSYGTRVWWPFNQDRVALDLISVIDPVFTIPIVACVALAVRYASRRAAGTALVWAGLYLGFCLVQRHRASTVLDDWITRSGLQASTLRRELKPSFGNVILWRGLVQAGGECHVTAIRCPLFGSPVLLAGKSHPVFGTPAEAATALGLPPDSIQAADIGRFFHFSDGWVGRHPSEPMVLGDLRYAHLPTDISPLWGILCDASQPMRHVEWRTYRGDPTPSLGRLFRLVKGAPGTPPATTP